MSDRYTSLFPRVKAAFLDAVLMILFMYVSSELLAEFETVPNYVRVILFVFIVILYEPLLVSLWGKTLGHHKMDICVRKEENLNQKIGFPNALLRYTIKLLLGWLSFITITNSDKHQAIHDRMAKSVMLRENE